MVLIFWRRRGFRGVGEERKEGERADNTVFLRKFF